MTWLETAVAHLAAIAPTVRVSVQNHLGNYPEPLPSTSAVREHVLLPHPPVRGPAPRPDGTHAVLVRHLPRRRHVPASQLPLPARLHVLAAAEATRALPARVCVLDRSRRRRPRCSCPSSSSRAGPTSTGSIATPARGPSGPRRPRHVQLRPRVGLLADRLPRREDDVGPTGVAGTLRSRTMRRPTDRAGRRHRGAHAVHGLERRYLFEKKLVPYVSGEDATVETGVTLGYRESEHSKEVRVASPAYRGRAHRVRGRRPHPARRLASEARPHRGLAGRSLPRLRTLTSFRGATSYGTASASCALRAEHVVALYRAVLATRAATTPPRGMVLLCAQREDRRSEARHRGAREGLPLRRRATHRRVQQPDLLSLRLPPPGPHAVPRGEGATSFARLIIEEDVLDSTSDVPGASNDYEPANIVLPPLNTIASRSSSSSTRSRVG